MFTKNHEFISSAKNEKVETLDSSLTKLVRSQNEKYGTFLSPDGTVDMRGFSSIDGYDVEADEGFNRDKEEEWSDANTSDAGRLAFFQERGLTTPELRLADWKRKKESSENEKLEKAVVVFFNKMIGEQFLVVRASKYDDYRNGVDTIIIDKLTHKVVGAFDEVKGEQDFKRNLDKKKKMLDKAKRGGARLKYGLNFTKNEVTGEQKLVKGEIRNLPLFIISMTKQELTELVNGMNSQTTEVTDMERNKFNQLLESFTEQVNDLEKERQNIHQAVFLNLQYFKDSLDGMRGLVNER